MTLDTAIIGHETSLRVGLELRMICDNLINTHVKDATCNSAATKRDITVITRIVANAVHTQLELIRGSDEYIGATPHLQKGRDNDKS